MTLSQVKQALSQIASGAGVTKTAKLLNPSTVVNLIGQSAAIAATDIIPAAQVDGGLYLVKGIVRVTTAAGTSSSVNTQVTFTEDDGGIVVLGNAQGLLGSNAAPAVVVSPANATDMTGIFYFLELINARAGVAIRYRTVYASNPANAMVYNLHLTVSHT